MSEKPPVVVRFCPACSAQNSLDAAQCWLCRAEFLTDESTVAPPRQPLSPLSFTLSTLLVVVTLAAVIFGVAQERPA